MYMDSFHDTTVSVDVDGDRGGSTEAPSNDNGRLEKNSSNKDVIREIGSDLIRLGLDLACCSEKLVNMNLLMMHVAEKESDFEAFTVEKEDKLVYSAEAALEFDLLSGFFDVEVKEMDKFIGKLEIKYKNASDVISLHKHMEEVFLKLEEKLCDAEKSLKQSQEQVSELMVQSAKFQRIVYCANTGETFDEDKNMDFEENGEFFNTTAKQQHILMMLEKSLARELDLDNQLTESMQTLDKMKRKLHCSQQAVLSAEEETVAVYARFLEADNASAVLMGISKELMGQLQSCQLNINSALCRESELNTKLQNCMQAIHKLEKEETTLREVAEKNSLESLVLKEKVNSLEEQLKASEATILKENVSLSDSNEQHDIKALEEKVFVAESKAEKAEAESKLLSITIKELNEELDLLKRNDVSYEKFISLEKQLRETDFQLQQAMISREAGQEKQAMLCSSIEDMEIVIEKLRINVSSAETRAEKAECECSLLAEANEELKMELDLVKANSISNEKAASLEKQHREMAFQLQQATASIEAGQEKQTMLCSSVEDMEIVIEKLKTNVSSAETRAEKAECECSLLAEANKELEMEQELVLVRVKDIFNEKVASLQMQLKETDIQLQQATASLEASREKQTMLYSLINDMKILIEKLKSKVSEADARSDSAEEKCIILSESHGELNEELNFLRNKVESLEASLQQAEETKMSASKDINIRTKVITDLVLQLALERERLQKQISLLMEDNRALAEKMQMVNKASCFSMNREIEETEIENGIVSSEHHGRSFDTGKANRKIPGTTEVTKSAEDVINGESNSESEEMKSKLETVRTIDAGRLTFRYILLAILIALIAVLATCFLSTGNCPF